MLSHIKDKKGSSTVYELLLSLVLLTFIIMFPISLFSYLHRINSINDVMGLAIQSLEQNGRFDEALYGSINSNLRAKNLPELGVMTNANSNTQNSYLLSNLAVTKIENNNVKVVKKDGVEIVTSNVSILQSDKQTHTYTNATYAVKYRNAFSFASNPNLVYYDMTCTCKNTHFYLTKNDKYVCPYCNKISYLDINAEAQVVSLTIYVPVNKQLESMAKLIGLISFGTIDATQITTEMGNIQKQVDGNYYFVRTYYGVAEPYYYIGNEVGTK